MTLGDHRPKVTATFFNAKYHQEGLVEGTRIMLSGEVGYFKGTMQLTHPAFLVLDSPSGKEIGTKSLAKIAEASQATSGEILLSAFERDFFPIYAASAKVQSWDIYACVRQVLDVLDPVDEPLPESLRAAAESDFRRRGAAAIHLAENEADRERARERLTYDEAVGLQWALVGASEQRAGRIRTAGADERRRSARGAAWSGCRSN